MPFQQFPELQRDEGDIQTVIQFPGFGEGGGGAGGESNQRREGLQLDETVAAIGLGIAATIRVGGAGVEVETLAEEGAIEPVGHPAEGTEVAQFHGREAGGGMQEDEVIAQFEARVVEAGVGPEGKQAVGEETVRVGVARGLGQEQRAAQAEHGDGPGRQFEGAGGGVGEGVKQFNGSPLRVERDADVLADERAGPGEFHPSRQGLDLQTISVGDIGGFGRLRGGPQAVTALEKIFAAGTSGAQVVDIGKEVGRSAQGEAEDARAGGGEIFQPDMLIFEYSSGESMKVSHRDILSSGGG